VSEKRKGACQARAQLLRTRKVSVTLASLPQSPPCYPANMHNEIPTIIVRLQHLGEGAKRIYISEVRGSVHICTYGLPGREDKWVVRVMSFGVGGELADIASHKAILRKKQCKSYSERRGAYTELVGDEQFVGSGSSSHEQASEEEYLERIEFSLMTNSIQDEDVDDEYDENEE